MIFTVRPGLNFKWIQFYKQNPVLITLTVFSTCGVDAFQSECTVLRISFGQYYNTRPIKSNIGANMMHTVCKFWLEESQPFLQTK